MRPSFYSFYLSVLVPHVCARFRDGNSFDKLHSRKVDSNIKRHLSLKTTKTSQHLLDKNGQKKKTRRNANCLSSVSNLLSMLREKLDVLASSSPHALHQSPTEHVRYFAASLFNCAFLFSKSEIFWGRNC